MYSIFPSFRRQAPDAPRYRFCTLPLTVPGLPTCKSYGLRLWLAGSPQRPAELRSSSYGPTVHLQLLPTSPRGDAVSFGYQAGERMLAKGLSPF
jgi:hypothetical protein